MHTKAASGNTSNKSLTSDFNRCSGTIPPQNNFVVAALGGVFSAGCIKYCQTPTFLGGGGYGQNAFAAISGTTCSE